MRTPENNSWHATGRCGHRARRGGCGVPCWRSTPSTSQRLYNIGKAFVELKRREIGHRRRRGDSAAVDDDDGRSPDSVLFGAPRFGAPRAEREELLSVDGSAPTSPV